MPARPQDTLNPHDEVIAEVRSDGSTTKTNYDPAGNPTDVCYWKPGISVGACLPADTAGGSWPNPPTQARTAAYDARNGRITLTTRLGTDSMVATSIYDPDHAYQVSAVYLLTAGGREVHPVGTTPWTSPPTSSTTTTYDARNNLRSLADAATNTTTVYDPDHNYQPAAFYVPTGSGKELQTLYGYDTQHRLTGITHQLCTISSGHSCA